MVIAKGALRHPAFIVALGTAGVWGWARSTPVEPVEAFTPQEMRELLRKEISPLRAGIEELAKSQSLETQNKVLRAMMRAERRAEEAN